MTNPYILGANLTRISIKASLDFQNDLYKIGASTLQSNPVLIWMKLVVEDSFGELLSNLTSLNRNKFY